MNRFVRHVSYANVAASLALVVAVGGTGYAATQLPKDSVKSKQVKDGSLRSKDFKSSDLAQLTGPAGPAGPAGSPATADPSVNKLIPVAVFALDDTGGLRPNITFRSPVTSTPTVSHAAGSGIYDVTLPGINIFSSTSNGNVLCTSGSSGGGVVSAGSANNKVRVFTFNAAGAASDLPTQCAVYYQP